MSGALPKLLVLSAFLTLAPIALVSACTGSSFQDASSGSGASSGNGSSGNASGGGGNQAGSGNGASKACGGPEDCNDGDACTNDSCTNQGTCAAAPRCPGDKKCCEGDCAQCCDDADCDDGVGCTTNTCFAGQCMFLPDDAACGAEEYCSVTESCKPKVPCLVGDPSSTVCADSSACTTDSCVEGFCQNEFCAQGKLCCDTGCADECCDDSQCNTDQDPCTVGVCQAGKCSTAPLCAGGDKCCPSADGVSATCGSCCSASECDDEVPCTDDACTGAHLTCKNNPNNAKCAQGEVCSATKGCQKQVECDGPEDCGQEACGRCDQGVCKYDCSNGQTCCAASNTCAACCGDASCDDGISCTKDSCGATGCKHVADDALCLQGFQCRPEAGGCVACVDDAGCDDGNACTTDKCSGNSCVHVSTCECKTAADCQGPISAKIARPIGGTCPSCVDGKCQLVKCLGSCCTSGCYFDLCPD